MATELFFKAKRPHTPIGDCNILDPEQVELVWADRQTLGAPMLRARYILLPFYEGSECFECDKDGRPFLEIRIWVDDEGFQHMHPTSSIIANAIFGAEGWADDIAARLRFWSRGHQGVRDFDTLKSLNDFWCEAILHEGEGDYNTLVQRIADELLESEEVCDANSYEAHIKAVMAYVSGKADPQGSYYQQLVEDITNQLA